MRKTLSKCLKTALFSGIMFVCQESLHAQTPAENLQTGVEIYNAMRVYCDDLSPKTLTSEQVGDVKNRMDKGLVLLEKVIKEGNAAEIKAARYFKTNFKYEYAFVLGMKGDNKTAAIYCQEIEDAMNGYSAADFPIRYVFFDKNYVVNWENFAATHAEYFTGYGEIAYNLGQFENAVRLTRRAIDHPNTTEWLKYIAINKMLDIYAKNNSYLTELEYIDFGLRSIKVYHALSEDNKKTAADNSYPTDKRGISIILDNAVKNVPAAVARCGEAAIAAMPGTQTEKNLQLFDVFYKAKQVGDAKFHTSADEFARKAFSSFPTKATIVGIAATDQMAASVSTTDCAGLSKIIDSYTFWKETTKASQYRKKQQECLENEEKARKKAQKRARRANSNFNLYAGAYILPLIKSNPKRDYGAALNFAFKKTTWEFSYLKINMNKENVQDLTFQDIEAKQTDITRWDGFYAHIQPKFILSKAPGYAGILFGYAQKEFEPITVNVTHIETNTFSAETFAPKVTQYILMGNLGALMLVKGFGLDMYYGMGATFSQWELGNDLDNEAYLIDNPVLENRKQNYFGVIMRVGMTMGLNFGRGNNR